MKLQDRLWHRRCRDFASFDRIELKVTPRYKTSGLSGDELRTGVVISFFFKGEQVHETFFTSMRTAVMFLGAEWTKAQEPIPIRVIEIEEKKCDQPGCHRDAIGRYQLKRLTSDHGESLHESEHTHHYFRKFCRRHLRRGDCGREDSDENYEPLDGVGPDDSSNLEESPAAFGGVIELTDETDIAAELRKIGERE
jgi:hypothetical protein